MLSKVYSAQVLGLQSMVVMVEVDISKSLKSFTIVGLPDKAVDEAKDRISAAIKNSGFPSPHKGNKKTVVALAPADIKKEGPVFDLAIAVGHLLASEEITFDPKGKLFVGELSLNGEIRPIKGALMLARLAREKGFTELFLPVANATEAALIEGVAVYPCRTLKEVVEHLEASGTKRRKRTLKNPPGVIPGLTRDPALHVIPNLPALSTVEGSGNPNEVNAGSLIELGMTQYGTGNDTSGLITPQPKTEVVYEANAAALDFSDVRGQESAKRGLEIAAAGGHNIAMYGPPGTGKTMLAKAFLGILPPLEFDEILEVTGIHSAAGHLEGALVTQPPFRSPHHTSSSVAVIGGGAVVKPGEITLAHRGVLFLDEFPEFDRRVLEAMRQPLEERVVYISRAKSSAKFPAHFILIAAMNPCPCGNKGAREKLCECPQGAIQNYERKMSGPIMDRIDLWLEVPHIEYEKLSDQKLKGEGSATVRDRVSKARAIARARFGKENSTKENMNENGVRPPALKGSDPVLPTTNASMGVRELEKFAELDPKTKASFNAAARALDLSARAYHRVIKLARTIADLDQSEPIREAHVMEALQYRPKTRR